MGVKENQQNVAKFDEWAKTYDQGRMNQWFTHGQAKALDAAGLKEEHWILDVGCGTGRAVLQAAAIVVKGKACGIDLSPGMISQANESAKELSLANVEFRVADAEEIPYPDGSFDAIICTNSFHHYSTPVQSLGEMRRVLKPGGLLVIRDPNRAGCLWIWLWDRFLRVFEKGHVQYHTEHEVMGYLAKAGLEQAVKVDWEHSHFRNGKIGTASYLIKASKDASLS